MAKTFFKQVLATHPPVTEKKEPGTVQPDAVQPDASVDAVKSSCKTPEIYDDNDVARLLGIKRRVIVAARKKTNRGEDWDCVDMHAGMTRRWIDAYALEHGIVPRYAEMCIKPIEKNDGVVTVVLIGTHPNPTKCTVELVATGEREFANVRDLYRHPIHLRECFQCRRIEMTLNWVAQLNEVAY